MTRAEFRENPKAFNREAPRDPFAILAEFLSGLNS